MRGYRKPNERAIWAKTNKNHPEEAQSCYHLSMLKIVKDNIPSLREKCAPVELPLSAEDKKTLDEMLDYLKLSQDENYRKEHPECREGVGLAAPQIGVNKRMLVVYYPVIDEDKNVEYVVRQLVNPKIISNSIRKAYLSSGEGCLSVDAEHEGYVLRHFKIVIKAYDAMAEENVTLTVRGYDAIVLQHEMDHLDGILFYDRINKDNPFYAPNDAVSY